LIYLDNNATTPVDPAVVEAMLPYLREQFGNPSSGYGLGNRARAAIDHAREQIAALTGCRPNELIFTSSGTESNNTAIRSALELSPERQHIITSTVEHSATLRLCEQLAANGTPVTFLGVDGAGNLDLDELEHAIRPETALVTLHWANNETGVLFPIEQVAAITRRNRVLLHVDAVQAAGKLPVRMHEAGVQLCSFSAHKIHGPKGVGALFVSARAAFRPLLLGGGQENGRRSGTENVPGIVGFGKAAELAAEYPPHVQQLRDGFESAVLAQLPDTLVNGNRNQRLPNTTSLAFAGVESDAALIMLDQAGICCSAGSACRTGAAEPSHVLRAMNLSPERQRGTLRFSFSRMNTAADSAAAAERVGGVIAKLRRLAR
jgi:cysteine desulfurase